MKIQSIIFRFTLGFCLLTGTVHGQDAIDVLQSTMKVPGVSEKVFYYGFAEGDKIIFAYEDVDNKELKELEIIELPGTAKFQEYKVKKVEKTTFAVQRTGIYKFRFYNSALGGRTCKVKIQRVPQSESSRHFNTTVYWQTRYDTIYTPVEERYIERADTTYHQVIEQIAKVSSQSALNGNNNYALVDFDLPAGTTAWSYYIGVGTEGMQAYEQAKDKFVQSAVTVVAKAYGPLGALALSGLNAFSKVQGRDNVKYYFIQDWNNVLQFQQGQPFYHYKQGDVINDAAQMRSPLAGKVYLMLSNDNIMDPIEVTVKVMAVSIAIRYATRIVQRMTVNAREVAYLQP